MPDRAADCKVRLLCLVLTAACAISCARARDAVDVTVTRRVTVRSVVPIGINLGIRTSWGAEQLLANVIRNPGFEGLVDGAIALPLHSGLATFDDSPAWLARPDGFWEGARFRIRSGPDAGREGRIASSSRRGPARLPVFSVQPGDAVPGFGSAVALVKITDDALPAQWWFSGAPGNSFSPAPGVIRPGSPGLRSLRITATGTDAAQVASYLDTIGERAGKMLPLTGRWTLSFWAKRGAGTATLHVSFRRDKSVPVLSSDVLLTAAWTNYRLSGEGRDDGPAGPVSLAFSLTGKPSGQIFLDDVDLRRADDTGEFRREAVAALRALHPGYLRDWQGQLGDTLENRLAPPFARRSFRYRPGAAEANGGDAQSDFGYGLGEFLRLAGDLRANPWLVIPPTFSDEECAGLGDYLASGPVPAGREVLAEFGNESWNELFRPGGIPDPVMYGQAAGRCFRVLREHARGVALRTVMGVQFEAPDDAMRFAAENQAADIIAFAPYFLHSLSASLGQPAGTESLFRQTGPPLSAVVSNIKALHRDAAIYEINLNATAGNATGKERTKVVAGMPAGTALAARLMESLALGIRRQCVYTLAGFDTATPETHGFAPLWGVVRDLGPTRRFRPTGLALEMLNHALRGDLRAVEQRGQDDVSVYALGAREGVTAVIAVSASAHARFLTVHLPVTDPTGTPWRVFRLRGKTADSTNEEAEDVRIVEELPSLTGNTLGFGMDPWGLVVAEPTVKGKP